MTFKIKESVTIENTYATSYGTTMVNFRHHIFDLIFGCVTLYVTIFVHSKSVISAWCGALRCSRITGRTNFQLRTRQTIVMTSSLRKNFENFFSRKIRQIEVRSALLCLNVDKLSKFS